MKKVNIPPYLHIYTKILSELSGKDIVNLTGFIEAITDTYGVIEQKLANGETSGSCALTQINNGRFAIRAGHIITTLDNEIVFLSLPRIDFNISEWDLDCVYYMEVVPRKGRTEAGYLEFTPGSKTVSVVGGTFEKLNPYETITTELGDFQVSAEINESSLELVEAYTGSHRTGISWGILGYYGNYTVNSTTIYEYDAYDILATKDAATGTGVLLGTVSVDATGIIDNITDLRDDSFYKIKGVHQVNADAIDTGALNAITTLGEKYSAYSHPLFISDFFTSGVRVGLAPTLSDKLSGGDYSITVSIGSAYNSVGKRIAVSTALTILLNANTSVGENYLYVRYTSYNETELVILDSQTTDDDYVLICKVTRSALVRPPYTITDMRSYTKFKASGFQSEGRSGGYGEGDLYYVPMTNGNGKYAYRRMNKTGDEIEEIELMNYSRTVNEINSAINDIAKKERLRFSLYPEVGNTKDGWFLHQGVASPAIVGYPFIVNQVVVGIAPVSAIDTGAEIVADIMNHADNLSVKKSVAYSVVGTTVTGSDEYAKNSFVGLYYNHITGKAELIINGVVISDSISVGTLTGNQVITAEIEIQTIESTATIENPLAE